MGPDSGSRISLVFSVRARKKSAARDKIHRSRPFGADGRVNKSDSNFAQTNRSEQDFRVNTIDVDSGPIRGKIRKKGQNTIFVLNISWGQKHHFRAKTGPQAKKNLWRRKKS